MNKEIAKALREEDPIDLIRGLELCFDCDREHLELEPNEGRRVLVAAAMFANVFGASGYAGVVYELGSKLQLIEEALRVLGIINIAQELQVIRELARSKGIALTDNDDDGWSDLVAENHDFRSITQRDMPTADDALARAMKQYVQGNAAFFGPKQTKFP